jgi:hypothetical protein
MKPQTSAEPTPKDDATHFADDVLRGADAIAKFLFGEKGSRRKVYYLAQCTKIPIFRIGSVLCARRSVLLNWVAGQESRAALATKPGAS